MFYRNLCVHHIIYINCYYYYYFIIIILNVAQFSSGSDIICIYDNCLCCVHQDNFIVDQLTGVCVCSFSDILLRYLSCFICVCVCVCVCVCYTTMHELS